MKNKITGLISRVEETIRRENMMSEVRHLVVGFSGGPDSMCLLDILITLFENKDVKIVPVHVNHGIRKDVCDREAEFCEKFASDRGLEIEVFTIDCEKEARDRGISTEEAGRLLRYMFFDQVARKYECSAIAVGQNANDQVETILMRILRGTGTDGLSGIPYVRESESGVKIIRPILDLFREEIVEYLDLRGLSPLMDKTNSEPVYNRNRIRLELLPYLKEKYNPSIEKAVLRLGKSAREDRKYLDLEAESALKDLILGEGRTIMLDGSKIRNMDQALRRRVLLQAIKKAGLKEDMGSEHYGAIERIAFEGGPSAMINLPKGYFLRNVYENMEIGRESDAAEVTENEAAFEAKELTINEFRSLSLEDRTYCALDLDKLEEAFGDGAREKITKRKRLPGDRIKLKVGTKKIQDVLVDDKMPKSIRDDVSVAAIGSDVLWLIPGEKEYMRWAFGFGIEPRTVRVLLLK